MIRGTWARYGLALVISIWLAGPLVVTAQPTSLAPNVIAPSGQTSVIRNQLSMARKLEKQALEGVMAMPGDNSTPIEDIEKLLPALADGADIAIGSRWVDPQLQTEPQPWYRRLNGRFYNLLLRTILGMDYKDTQNGFKAFSRRAAKAIFGLQKIAGWGFDAETLYLARSFGFSVREIPVEYIYYAEGSKIHPYRDGARMLVELLRVKWYGLTGAYFRSTSTRQSAVETLSSVALHERPSD